MVGRHHNWDEELVHALPQHVISLDLIGAHARAQALGRWGYASLTAVSLSTKSWRGVYSSGTL